MHSRHDRSHSLQHNLRHGWHQMVSTSKFDGWILSPEVDSR